MENIAQVIVQPGMVLVFVSIILLVALRPLYQAIFSINIVNRDLDSATRVLINLGQNQQEEFYNQFKTIHTQISRIPGLRHAWREFVDSLYFQGTTLPNAPKKVYLSHRPSHYFNRESVLGTRLNISQFLAYPNYLIGIGLTFTFIGLAAALHVAQAGLATGASQQALKDLLAVASVKFISSIVGIASSLIISALQRISIRIFQQKLDMFCDLLEECTKFKATEKLLHDSFTEQAKQTAMLGDMAKNIAVEIGDAMGSQLSLSVANALEPLAQEIRSLAKSFAEGSEKTLSKMLADFSHELRKSSADEMRGLMDNIGRIRGSLNELAENMQSAGKGFNADIKTSAGHLAEAALNLKEAGGTVAAAAERFERSAGMIERSEAAFSQKSKAFEAAAQEIAIAAETLGKAVRQTDATAIASEKNGDTYFSKLKSRWLK